MTRQQLHAGAPVIVLGAGPLGLSVAAHLARSGGYPIIVGPAPEMTGATMPDALMLSGRIATALWGSLESGFNVETDTGETVTGAAIIIADAPAAAHCARTLGDSGRAKAPITGQRPVVRAATGETGLEGVFVAPADGAAAVADAAIERIAAFAAKQVERSGSSLAAPHL